MMASTLLLSRPIRTRQSTPCLHLVLTRSLSKHAPQSSDASQPERAAAPTASPTTTSSDAALPSLSSLLALSKARLSLLVVTTTTLGFLSAGPSMLATIDGLSKLTSVTIGTALCSSSAASINQIVEVDRDSRMKRTRNRVLISPPSPSSVNGEKKQQGTAAPAVTIPQATIFAISTAVAGSSILYCGTDPVTTMLGAGNIVLYSGIYTYMKPRSEWNTWVGAVVGAIPPVMGYTAATGGSIMDAEPLLLGSTLFLWQFPHFFALNWMYREDYKRGGFAMVATSDPTGSRTSSLINHYTLYLSTIPILSSGLTVTSPMFAIEGLLLNGYAIYVARKFDRDRSNANARKVFLTSLWYLPCLLSLFLLHSRKWHQENEEESPLKDVVRTIQDVGREMCLHEVIVTKDIRVVGTSSSGGEETTVVLDERACPISLTKKSSAAVVMSDVERKEDEGQ